MSSSPYLKKGELNILQKFEQESAKVNILENFKYESANTFLPYNLPSVTRKNRQISIKVPQKWFQ